MGDQQHGDHEGDEDGELQQLAAAVDDACRPVGLARRPRPLSALRDALGGGSGGEAHPTAAEIIERVRARRAERDARPGEAPGNFPEAPEPPEP